MAGRLQYNGILLIDKPVGITSHDVVDRLRRVLDQQGGGHTGTLDPLAGGLLIVCLGRASKISRFLTGMEKEYRALVRLGSVSSTFDSEGVDERTEVSDVPDMSREQMNELLDSFRGEIEQTVPPFAAVRVGGEKLYDKARRGEKINLPVRTVKISELELLSFDAPELELRVRCSKGTYIRSLAHDIGQQIGCGAYLKELRRTHIGPFNVDDALTVEEVSALHENGKLEERLLTIEEALPIGAIKITDEFAPRVRHGVPVTWSAVAGFEGSFGAGEEIALKDSRGAILAVGTAGIQSGQTPGGESEKLFRYGRVLQ